MLRAFIKRLLNGQETPVTDATGSKIAAPVDPASFVKRYIKWLWQLQKVG